MHLIDNLDLNRSGYDGCSALATSNWRQLREAYICYFENVTEPISALTMMTANWPLKSRVECFFESEIGHDIANIIMTSFK